jgi:Co/Zn/Cd efflux system component
VYLHVLSDAFSSVAVLCNALLVRWQGWLWVDTLQSLAVAAVTLYR